jgi:hypothetical protein
LTLVATPAPSLGLYLSAIFLYLVAAAYLIFVVSTAVLFGRLTRPPRLVRGINFLLVPPALLVAVLGIGFATLNAFVGAANVPSTAWALAMFGGGLGFASALLAGEGVALRRAGTPDRAGGSLSTRLVGLALTALPLLALGGVFVRVALGG